ncbi:MAG: CDGSH iron-sulfur domain-containing protein [Hydrogenobaculum sp.]
MARLVKLSGKGPVQIKTNEEKWVCTCGLSKTFPFCDGSHKKTKDEADGKLYIYGENERIELA